MDEIATFSNVTREIDYNLLPEAKKESAIDLHNNINNLLESQYPKYASTQGVSISAPPFFEISVLNGKIYFQHKIY